MKTIIGYIREYIQDTSKLVLLVVSIFTALLIFLNYSFGIDEIIGTRFTVTEEFLSRTSIFLLALGLPYVIYALVSNKGYFKNTGFLSLLFLGPLIFAAKMVIDPSIEFSDNAEINRYWNQVFYWPALCVIVSVFLLIIWKLLDSDQPFYGIKTREMNFRPYLLMLLIMVPLISAASTQPDFLAVYPKLNALNFGMGEMEISWWHKLLFELSYGTDFISIELFFRGFLILAFVKYAGKDAILPMACFYCTIHFGKPLGECISSYFGGLLLGIIVFHTRSILGGLMVHLGIAWLMEAGGFIGNSLK